MEIVGAYQAFTDIIEGTTGMSRPMLHVHAGMAIYLLGQLVLRNRRGAFLALVLVAEVAVFNEVMNRLYYGSWRWADTLGDLALTLFWPTLCFAVSRFRRWRWNAATRRGQTADLFRAKPTTGETR